jgi:UDP-2,3-diacylglucosamine pyrophosphatase LpxH
MLTGSETVTRSMRHNRIAKDQLLKYVISEYYEKGGPSIVAGHTHVKDHMLMPNRWKYINIGATKNGHILLLDTDSGIFKRVVKRWK